MPVFRELPVGQQRNIRKDLRTLSTRQLEGVLRALKGGAASGMEIVEQDRSLAMSAIEEILWERGKLPERSPEQNIGTQLLKTLVEHTIDDITYEQMSRIVHRLNRMSREDRGAPKRVAEVLYDELGVNKALQYVEKSFANGMIKRRDYDQIRTFLVFPKPRAVTVQPLAGMGSRQLLEGQKRLQQDLGKIRELGLKSLEKPIENLNKDIEKLRRAWGM